jgi:hypothetical protein
MAGVMGAPPMPVSVRAIDFTLRYHHFGYIQNDDSMIMWPLASGAV